MPGMMTAETISAGSVVCSSAIASAAADLDACGRTITSVWATIVGGALFRCDSSDVVRSDTAPSSSVEQWAYDKDHSEL